MFLLIPYEVRTLIQRSPWANLGIMAVTIVASLLSFFDVWSEAAYDHFILTRDFDFAFIGHMLMHAGWLHLIGNMLMLFVFGNAICGAMSGWLYTAAYFTLGFFAGLAHLAIENSPVVGASGAVYGILGIYLAVYPLNRINCFWFFLVRAGVTGFPGWLLILCWFALDVLGVLGKESGVAHWAHIGGLVGGFALGVVLLRLGKIDIYDYDNPTVLDLLPNKSTPPAG
jgi:membrane associated rhomboid family serine protease